MKTTFKVLSSNPSNEGKTHVWKLETNTLAKVFGIEKNVKRTFYIGGMPVEAKVGTEIVEDLDKFEVVERPFDVVDKETGEVITVMLKWLHVKVA